LALLRDHSVAVLLCERDHADGNSEDVLKATARLPDLPNLIVFSRLADEALWAKVLSLGGFDVVMTPFEPEEALRVTFAAWSRWECDFGEGASKDATRTGRPAPVKPAPPKDEWLRALRETRELEDARPEGWAPISPVERLGHPARRSARLDRQLDGAA
jgi:hypothetical protein